MGALIHMTKPALKIVSPATVKRKVTPTRPKNADVRTREYLTEREIEKLIEACKDNRWAHRDQTMILLTFRHGLRASELCDLQWTRSISIMRAWPSREPRTERRQRP
jgi:type 1 fimbriae regulatory protein FimB/type 1 fimbriae regulatory protein FimE